MTIKFWNEERMIGFINSGSFAVGRCLIKLYERQTRDEQSSDATRWDNQVGFSAADARKGSYYARWVLSGRQLNGIHLERARKMAIKYRRQLVEIANERIKQRVG